jgi:hypothetical protein
MENEMLVVQMAVGVWKYRTFSSSTWARGEVGFVKRQRMRRPCS